MNDKQYPPSGALFAVKSQHPKAPQLSGPLEISKDLLKVLLEQANAGEPIKMRIAAYSNTHPTKGEWFRLVASKDEPYVKGGSYGNAKKSEPDPF